MSPSPLAVRLAIPGVSIAPKVQWSTITGKLGWLLWTYETVQNVEPVSYRAGAIGLASDLHGKFHPVALFKKGHFD